MLGPQLLSSQKARKRKAPAETQASPAADAQDSQPPSAPQPWGAQVKRTRTAGANATFPAAKQDAEVLGALKPLLAQAATGTATRALKDDINRIVAPSLVATVQSQRLLNRQQQQQQMLQPAQAAAAPPRLPLHGYGMPVAGLPAPLLPSLARPQLPLVLPPANAAALAQSWAGILHALQAPRAPAPPAT